MSNIEINDVVKGKVLRIKPFGAIMLIDDKIQGLVHISNVTHAHVKDINEHLTEGDIIDVLVLSIDEETGRLALSIKDLTPPPKKAEAKPKGPAPQNEAKAPISFEDKLKDWVKNANERQASINKRHKRR